MTRLILRVPLIVIYRIAVILGVAMALIAAMCSVGEKYLRGK